MLHEVRVATRSSIWALTGLVLGALSWHPVWRHAAAAEVLVRLSHAPTAAPAVSRKDLWLEVGSERVLARAYLPSARAVRCIVIGHGVHYLGIDEPRLMRFATELARVNVAVLTPELADLADYRVTRAGADVLGGAAQWFSERCSAKVGLLGFSFAGGLALLAAEDPRYAAHLDYVASVGGYEDLGRVLRFLLTDTVETPSGPVQRKAHEYGLVVLIYEHIDALVPAPDRAVMRAAVKAWLEEKRSVAWAIASFRTTLAAERLFVAIASGNASDYDDALRSVLKHSEAASESLSPRRNLRSITVPVLLLHGRDDSVIPAEESIWADRDLHGRPHRTLVTPLIEHVEIAGTPTLMDRLRLVHFMAALL